MPYTMLLVVIMIVFKVAWAESKIVLLYCQTGTVLYLTRVQSTGERK